MRLVTIKKDKLKKYTADKEMLQKAKRPCVLIVKLAYRGKRYDFAVPLRSNISPSTPKWQYFALPPRPGTKSKFRHGIHYIKMFPIDRSSVLRFRTKGNAAATRIKSIIDKHEKEIIQSCQKYLQDYENGIHPKYSTNIDFLITLL